MRILSKKALKEFWEKHPDAEKPLQVWYGLTEKAAWSNPLDAKRYFSRADLVGKCTVFNIKGNDYRLVVKIDYTRQIVFIRDVLTHAEYDRGRWKNGCGC